MVRLLLASCLVGAAKLVVELIWLLRKLSTIDGCLLLMHLSSCFADKIPITDKAFGGAY